MARTKHGLPGIYNASPITLADGSGSALAVNASGQLVAAAPSGSSANQVQGTAADNAASTGNPVKVGGRYESGTDTYADGDVGDLHIDENGNLKVTAASITPGTGAANLGKAEDAVHTSGDVGVMALTVRSDTAASTAGTTGDYQPQITDASGNTWVREYYAPGYEDNTNSKAVVEHRYSGAVISSATTTTIKTGSGLIHTICILGGTLGAITVYDNTAGSGTTICPTFTPTAAVPCPTITLDQTFGTGLTVVTAAATVINVSYR